MPITDTQKKAAQEIIAVFETGKTTSIASYSTCTILKDGAGISYGKHQSTDRSDSLDQIVLRYLDLKGQYADELKGYVSLLSSDATSKVDPSNPPANVRALMDLLKKAGQDPIMQKAQDQIFDEGYWNPAVSQVEAMGLVLPLSYAIVYDTCIHSGPGGVAKIRKQFNEVPPARGGDEKTWARAYVNARRNWLLSISNSLVQKTVYRMDAFVQLMKEDNWDLHTPFKVRGVTIST